jgi:hypothetical protein
MVVSVQPHAEPGGLVSPNLSNRLLVALAAVVAGVGIAEATVHRNWDVLGLFSGIVALMVVLLLRTFSGRPAVPLRRDLVAWLDERAVSAGEPLEQVADRAVSAYRAGLSVESADIDRAS